MNKITLMEAYLIEYLKVESIPNEKIIEKSLSKETEQFVSLYPEMDFSLLTTLAAKDPDAFADIVNKGYQVKFLTINGLKKLLELKLSKQPTVDYTENDRGLEQLFLTDKELDIVQGFVSSQWQFEIEKVNHQNKVNIFVES